MSRQLSLFSYLKPKGSKRRRSSNEIEPVITAGDVDIDVKECLNKILEDVVNRIQPEVINITDAPANKSVNMCKINVNNVPKKSKNKTDYVMTAEKIESWKKDEKFMFWDTANGKPISDKSKKISWFKYNETEETFTCWICKKYPTVQNKENKVTLGCATWHQNYLIRHDDNKHQVIFS